MPRQKVSYESDTPKSKVYQDLLGTETATVEDKYKIDDENELEIAGVNIEEVFMPSMKE